MNNKNVKNLDVVVALVMVFFISSCSSQAARTNAKPTGNQPVKVSVEQVEKMASAYVYQYSGVIEPSVQTALSFQSIGTVQQILVDEGDVVRKGSVLAKLDDTSAASAYKASLATQKQAQDAYDRLKTVYEKGSLPEIKWEEIKTNLAQANASAEMAKQRLNNMILEAPYEGIISLRKIELGSSVNPATTAFEIVTIDEVYARIAVPEHEISMFKTGAVAEVNIPAVSASNFNATVEKIGVVANQLTKTYAVKLSIKNTNLEIKPGMVCDTKIELNSKGQLISVPMQAIINQPNENPYVFVVNSQHLAIKRPIKVGKFTNSSVEVISGLQEQDLVVVNGQQKLTHNMEVSF